MNNKLTKANLALKFMALKHPAVYVVGTVLVLVLLLDFNQRVWQPLEVRDSNLNELHVGKALVHEKEVRPEILAAWLTQQKLAKLPAIDPGSAGGQAQPVEALPGSTTIDSANIRIRAVFITAASSLEHNPKEQALALAEIQHKETGEISYAKWQVGDLVTGWQVFAIEPKRVSLRTPPQSAQQHIELYVFEPSQVSPEAREVESENK